MMMILRGCFSWFVSLGGGFALKDLMVLMVESLIFFSC